LGEDDRGLTPAEAAEMALDSFSEARAVARGLDAESEAMALSKIGFVFLKVLPLVLCLAGLWRHRMYTFRWLSLLLWLYFMEGVIRATTERGMSMALALVEIVLCVVLFACCSVYIRWRLRSTVAAGA
jgi:uncharacterized membrane protein